MKFIPKTLLYVNMATIRMFLVKFIMGLLLLSTVHAAKRYDACHVSEKPLYELHTLQCDSNATTRNVSLLPLSQYYYHTGTDNPDTALLNQYRPWILTW